MDVNILIPPYAGPTSSTTSPSTAVAEATSTVVKQLEATATPHLKSTVYALAASLGGCTFFAIVALGLCCRLRARVQRHDAIIADRRSLIALCLNEDDNGGEQQYRSAVYNLESPSSPEGEEDHSNRIRRPVRIGLEDATGRHSFQLVHRASTSSPRSGAVYHALRSTTATQGQERGHQAAVSDANQVPEGPQVSTSEEFQPSSSDSTAPTYTLGEPSPPWTRNAPLAYCQWDEDPSCSLADLASDGEAPPPYEPR